MPHYPTEIEYSEKYQDDEFEYRHVMLPKEIFKSIPRGRLLSEREWRSIGVQQSRGWQHYEVHKPEPFILLFRRSLGTDPVTGLPSTGKIGTAWINTLDNLFAIRNSPFSLFFRNFFSLSFFIIILLLTFFSFCHFFLQFFICVLSFGFIRALQIWEKE